jgi:2-polyprenyl-3-methyl-5-hydroxy-6-metoxy-1,4-benzoquinol methylase
MPEQNSNKEHWENIYNSKKTEELSWTEDVPEISLAFIKNFQLPKTASIIDIGGGESKLAENLLDMGYVNITVLDISKSSIQKAKMRLGKRANKIKWMVQDVIDFDIDNQVDCWHDRAAFHFLTSLDQISKYAIKAKQYVKTNGYAVIGTFSENGPKNCSGLPIKQYNQETISLAFADGFEKLSCINHEHQTPFKTSQSFLYCSFQRI